jgi:hypothetical protein
VNTSINKTYKLYEDALFLEEVVLVLTKLGMQLDDVELDFTEQGMQDDMQATFDVDAEFCKQFMQLKIGKFDMC